MTPVISKTRLSHRLRMQSLHSGTPPSNVDTDPNTEAKERHRERTTAKNWLKTLLRQWGRSSSSSCADVDDGGRVEASIRTRTSSRESRLGDYARRDACDGIETLPRTLFHGRTNGRTGGRTDEQRGGGQTGGLTDGLQWPCLLDAANGRRVRFWHELSPATTVDNCRCAAWDPVRRDKEWMFP